MTIYQTSKTYNIPKTTIRDKQSHKYPHRNSGIQPVLSMNEENIIVHRIVYLQQLGFSVTKSQLIESVARLVKT